MELKEQRQIIEGLCLEEICEMNEENNIIDGENKENVLKEMFGVMKSKKSTEQLLAESRKELESKWEK